MSLAKMMTSEYEIMSQIAADLGEVSDELYENLEKLQQSIVDKIGTYAAVLNNGGLLDREIQRIKDAKADLNRYQKKLEQRKDWMKETVGYYVRSKPGLKIEVDGIERFVYPEERVERTVDQDKVPPEYQRFKVMLTGKELDALAVACKHLNAMASEEPHTEHGEAIADTAARLYVVIEEALSHREDTGVQMVEHLKDEIDGLIKEEKRLTFKLLKNMKKEEPNEGQI